MNDILQDIETAELHTFNTIKIISNLQDTITKLNQDEDASDSEMSQFEEEAEYLKKLAQRVADDLPPPVPCCSSVNFARNFVRKNAKLISSAPKFIKAKPKGSKEMYEKSQQTDKKPPKGRGSKKHNIKKQTQSVPTQPTVCSYHNDPPLQPTKYLQHILIPIGKVDIKNFSTQSMPGAFQRQSPYPVYKHSDAPPRPMQVAKRKSGVEHFAKLMQLCMDVKEERESDLEKQIYNLEEEMQAVMESNKNLYDALEKLEEQNCSKKVLKDTSTNTLTELLLSNQSDTLPDLSLDTNAPSEEISNDLAEDIIKCIHADIQEITSNIANTRSQSRLTYIDHNTIVKSKNENGKHVSFLEKAIASMQNKLETAQNKQVELAIQSKAVVEAAHRMSNKPWLY